MKPRLRKMESWRKEPLPTLKWTCRMCEAEFPNVELLNKHIDLLHGQYRFYSTWLGGSYSQSPYVVSPTENVAASNISQACSSMPHVSLKMNLT